MVYRRHGGVDKGVKEIQGELWGHDMWGEQGFTAKFATGVGFRIYIGGGKKIVFTPYC